MKRIFKLSIVTLLYFSIESCYNAGCNSVVNAGSDKIVVHSECCLNGWCKRDKTYIFGIVDEDSIKRVVESQEKRLMTLRKLEIKLNK